MSTLIVAALVRRGNEVLLVKEQGPDDPAPKWALPGGRVEQGEAIFDAVAREVFEETGLRVTRLGALRCVGHALDSVSSSDYLALTFEVDEWSGEAHASGTDEFVSECAFFALDRATELLSALPWRSIRKPGLAALHQIDGATEYFEFDGI